MRLIAIVVCFIISSVGALLAQDYDLYRTQENENLELISKKFSISASLIRELNPDVNFDKLSPGTMLILPLQKMEEKFMQHKVRLGETIFRLSRDYKVSVADIVRANPNLNINKLSVGQVVMIPTVKEDTASKQENRDATSNPKYYIVKSGDTSWSIARKSGIPLETLREINPHIQKGIKVGDTVVLRRGVRSEGTTGAADDIDHYVFYEAKRSESLYGISKRYGVTVEDIYSVNIDLKEKGLRAGYKIRIPIVEGYPKKEPKPVVTPISEEIEGDTIIEISPITVDELHKLYTPVRDFSNYVSRPFHNFPRRINNPRNFRVALVLPLKLGKYKHVTDTVALKERLLNDRITNLAMDFYMGARIAIDSLQHMGCSMEVEVFDSEGDEFVIASLISRAAFNDKDLVIGPLFSKPFNRLSQYLEYVGVPIVSPLSYKGVEIRSNTIISVPTDEEIRNSIVSYISEREYLSKKLLITKDDNQESIAYLQGRFPDIIRVPMTKNQISVEIDSVQNYLSFTKVDSLGIVLKEGIKNLVFLESDMNTTISSITSVFNSYVSDTCSVTLVTIDKNKAFDSEDVSNNSLSNLEFHYASVNNPLTDLSSSYALQFHKTFGMYPNRYATRGFDLTYDMIARLMEGDNVMEDLKRYRTKHVENMFDYVEAYDGGLVNQGVYVLKYKDMMRQEITR